MIAQRTSSRRNWFGCVAIIVALLLACSALQATAGKVPAGFTDHVGDVTGVKLHYFIGGEGSPVVLLHEPVRSNSLKAQ